MKAEQRRKYFLFWITVLLSLGWMVSASSIPIHAEEILPKENPIYDTLKKRMESSWDKGMEQIGEAESIEITGNIAERFFRSIAAALYRNLKSIKAGSLLVGIVSFVLGGTVALLARKDKKIKKKAVSIGMAAIPGLLFVFVFGASWFVSIFR